MAEDVDAYSYPDLAQYLGQSAEQRGRTNAATLLEPNPDQAAKDLELSKATGVPYEAVKADSDEIAHRKQKAENAAVLQQYPDLARWMGNNPGAAEVAYDDMPKLGDVSNILSKRFGKTAGALAAPNEAMGKAIEAFKDAMSAPYGEWLGNTPAEHQDLLKRHPELMSFAAGLGMPVEAFLRLFPAALSGASAGVQAGLQKLGATDQEAQRFTRDLTGMAEYSMMAGPGAAEAIHGMVQPAVEFAQAVSPYLRAGEVPPVGIHPIIDKLHAEEAKADIKNLDEAVRAAGSTALSERSPELLAALARESTNREVRISADGVRALYGDKVPEPEDNLLGWVPDIVRQLDSAAPGGGYIKVPLAEYVARVDPEVHKALHDEIAVGDGLTTTEAKDLGTPKPPVPSPDPAVSSVRQAAALEPSEPPPAPEQVKSEQLSDQDFEQMTPAARAFVAQQPFEKGALKGVMSQAEYNKYQSDIARRNAEDIEAATDKAAKEIRRRQTAEWKAREVEVRKEVEEAVRQRPDIAADDFFRKYRIDWDKLTREDADQVAGQFGYQTGEQLVNNHELLEGARGDIHPTYYKKKLADAETDRRMALRYGDLEENILKEARGQVLSSRAQEDVLIDELQAWAKRAGQDGSGVTREMIQSLAQEQAKGVIVKDFTEKNILAMVGKYGRVAEKALQAEDDATGFQAKQRQAINFYLAKEARKYEKERTQFDALAKRYQNRELKNREPEYTNFIHQILMQVGQRVKRSVQDLAGEIEASGHKDLASFVADKEAALREVPVADFLLDPSYQKNIDAHTLEDFRAVKGSLDTLDYNSRDEATGIYRGERQDREALRGRMIDQLKDLGITKEYPITPQGPLGKLARAGRTYFANSLQLESLFNRFDKGNPLGIFTQSLMRPLTEAGNYVARLERKYARRIRELKDDVDPREKAENSLWIDPLTGQPFSMTKGVVREILNHAGNASNWEKLTKGYGVDPNVAMQWLISRTSPADWKRAQHQGYMFDDLKKESDIMYRQLSGVAPAGLDLQPISNVHGNYEGWYYPVKYDPIRLGNSKRLAGPSALEQEGYFRATTPAGYTKGRTGYIGPVDISSSDIMPSMVRQMVHDIAFRPAVLNAGKMFYDPEFRKAITTNYGREYSELLVPYLKAVANNTNPNSAAVALARSWSETFRQNMLGTLVGMNPGTVLKHAPTAAINSITEVGVVPWTKWAVKMYQGDDATATSNWRMAVGKSEELQRRERHYAETIRGATEEVLGKQTFREWMLQLGSKPVAYSDMMSSIPTWLAQYEKSILAGSSEGDAVYLADRAVRRAHGSTAISSRPSITLNGGALGQWISSLYGFFSHILQRQYELGWQAADALRAEKPVAETRKIAPKMAAGLMSYVILPALIEQWVSGQANPKDSWAEWGAKVLTKGLSSSWIGLRDLGAAMSEGKDPQVGLLGTLFKTGTDTYRDFVKDHPLSRQHAGKLLQDTTTMIGALTGVVNAQEGRVLRAVQGYMAGTEHPRDTMSWYKLLRHGTLRHQQ